MQAEARQRKNTIWIFIILGFLILLTFASFMVNTYFIYIAAYAWFGFIVGMLLQYGRFCFASAFRDLFGTGVSRMFVGVFIAVVVFGAVAALVAIIGLSTFSPAPFGYYQIIGGIVFGIGMVLAGGCASGSWYKAGEGSIAAMLIILSLSISQNIFVALLKGEWVNIFVPQSWQESAAAKGLPESLTVSTGWFDQYLAGFVWDFPAATFAARFGYDDASVLGAFVFNFLVGVVIPVAILLLAVYFLFGRKQFLKEAGHSGASLSRHLRGFWQMLAASKRTSLAGLGLGITLGLQIFTIGGLREKFGIVNWGELMQRMGITFGLTIEGTVFDPGYWYITTQEAQWVGWVMQKLGVENMDNIFFGYINGIPFPFINPADWMLIAMFLGAAVMALAANEFKWKKPSRETAFWAITGGMFMGIGARLALGCNVGAFIIRISHGDPNGWLFGIGLAIGAFVSVKFFNWWLERQLLKAMRV